MKLAFLGGALALAALSACAGITDKTGIDAAQQQCVAQTLVAMQSDAATRDLRLQQKAALVAASCGISADQIILKLAE